VGEGRRGLHDSCINCDCNAHLESEEMNLEDLRWNSVDVLGADSRIVVNRSNCPHFFAIPGPDGWRVSSKV
jgi:hypothetical protein